MPVLLRQIIASLLLIAFGTQLMAAVQGCDLASGQSSATPGALATKLDRGAQHDGGLHTERVSGQHHESGHDHHAMMARSQASDTTCCDLELQCDMSQCGLSAGLLQQTFSGFMSPRATPQMQYTGVFPIAYSDALYHPPRHL